MQGMQEQIENLQMSNTDLVNGNTALQSNLEQMTSVLRQSKNDAEAADFERDEASASEELIKKSVAPKEKRFLLNELQQIKEQLHQKLMVFKSRT